MAMQGNPQDEEPPRLTPDQVDYLRHLRVSVEFVDGPKDGEIEEKLKVFKAPFDRLSFINRQCAHYYTLEGCLDDGFHFKYRGVWKYKCLGRGKYQVLEEMKG
jgi:hypothetical protein